MPSNGPIQSLHAETPLRVWSLIVTIFGDVVMRGGTDPAPGPIWTGALLALLEEMKIDPGLVRTSLSRLVANGTLLREKTGRNTYYRPAPASRAAFMTAADRIYGRLPLVPTGQFDLALIDRCPARTKAREALLAQGFRFVGATTAVLPVHAGSLSRLLPEGAILARTDCTAPLAETAQDLWQIHALNQRYNYFLRVFTGLSGGNPTPVQAIVSRVILLHQFRRLILRDPVLPAVALPEDWQGRRARECFKMALEHLEPASERWLTETGFRSGIIQPDS
ncbi:MAG: PaaX family transcriptional regulator C-terminal domain-containing protein [Beijerinckiaceae bacterium]